MKIDSIGRSGSNLTISGVIMSSIPMTAELRPSELRRGFTLIKLRQIPFLLSLLFRK